jgi:guanidinoacetate N-methyltransferase
MTRKFKRLPNFDISLLIKNDGYIRPPRESQRNWLLNQAINEFILDLEHYNEISDHFVPGDPDVKLDDRTQSALKDEEIMEDWQVPIMRAMASKVTQKHGDILEIGFGIGASATYIQEAGVRSHTIVECNDSVVERYELWKENYPGKDIQLIHGLWQETTDQFEMYDGIFFHTYPLNESEYLENIANSVTYAGHFFPTASAHLREGGVFTYLTNEIDSFSRAHQRLLFNYFTNIELEVVHFEIPTDVKDAWWSNSMVVIKAIK